MFFKNENKLCKGLSFFGRQLLHKTTIVNALDIAKKQKP